MQGISKAHHTAQDAADDRMRASRLVDKIVKESVTVHTVCLSLDRLLTQAHAVEDLESNDLQSVFLSGDEPYVSQSVRASVNYALGQSESLLLKSDRAELVW